MKKIIILNFQAFDKKDGSKSYYKMTSYDMEARLVFDTICEQVNCPVPGGVVPSKDEQKRTFPRAAEALVEFVPNMDGKTFRPVIKEIASWKDITSTLAKL